MWRLDEGEGEGLERLFRAQPDVFVGPYIDVDAEGLGVIVADPAVQPVGGDDDVGVQRTDVGDLALEPQVDAQRPGALVQDGEQPLTSDARESVAAGADGLAVDMDVDVVPMDEGGLDDSRGLGVIGLQIGQGLVGKDHPPAKGVVRAVTLVDYDVERWIAQLQGYGEVQAARPGAHNGDASDSLIS